MSTQIAIRLTNEELEDLDWVVMHCTYDSRAEALRTALAELTDRLRREEIGRQIVEGYRRIPPTDEEMAWAEANAHRSIAEEPWEKWW